MKNSLVAIYLLVIVLVGVSMVILLTGSTGRKSVIGKLRGAYLEQLPPHLAAQVKKGEKVILNSDSVYVRGIDGTGMSIKNIVLDKNAYYCNFSVNNGTEKTISYVMYMAVQEQKKDGSFRDILHIGDNNSTYLQMGSSRRYAQSFPLFERRNNCNYRVYMQLMDSSTNSQQFVCDGAMPF